MKYGCNTGQNPVRIRSESGHIFNHQFGHQNLQKSFQTGTRTFRDALLSYRDAVLRYAYAMRRLYANRLYSNLVEVVPEVDRDRFANLIAIGQTGLFTLARAFQAAVDAAIKNAVDQ